jgi:hypothetical protein
MGTVKGLTKEPAESPNEYLQGKVSKMAEQLNPENTPEVEDVTVEELDEISGGSIGTFGTASCPLCCISSISN